MKRISKGKYEHIIQEYLDNSLEISIIMAIAMIISVLSYIYNSMIFAIIFAIIVIISTSINISNMINLYNFKKHNQPRNYVLENARRSDRYPRRREWKW